MFYHDVQAEVFKHMVTESAADRATDGIVQSFHHATGQPFVEIVQELIPPVLYRLGELYQLGQAGGLRFEDPGLQETFCTLPVLDFICDSPELLFQQVSRAQFRESR